MYYVVQLVHFFCILWVYSYHLSVLYGFAQRIFIAVLNIHLNTHLNTQCDF